MTIIGYARVSTSDQDLSIQEEALRAVGCNVIRAEKRSGTTTEGREQLQTVLDFLRPGDVLMATRIDRLARSLSDLQDIVRTLKARGASLKATEQASHWKSGRPAVSTPHGGPPQLADRRRRWTLAPCAVRFALRTVRSFALGVVVLKYHRVDGVVAGL